MINVFEGESTKRKYNSDYSQLVLSYDKIGRNKSYVFDNVIFAQMKSGVKDISIHNQKEFRLRPNEVIMSTNLIEVDVNIPDEVKNNPAVCFRLEIERERVWDCMDRVLNKNESWFNDEVSSLPSLGIYSGNGSVPAVRILDQLEKIITSNTRFKDKWIGIKLEELILCCLQTNMYQMLINAYNEHNLISSPINEVIQFLKENFDKKITIEQLSQKACMSQATLFRHFKNKLGVTPFEFINSERIKNAEKVLLDPSISISEVGYMVGFNSPSYFNSQFKKINECSPSEFRKMKKNQIKPYQ